MGCGKQHGKSSASASSEAWPRQQSGDAVGNTFRGELAQGGGAWDGVMERTRARLLSSANGGGGRGNAFLAELLNGTPSGLSARQLDMLDLAWDAVGDTCALEAADAETEAAFEAVREPSPSGFVSHANQVEHAVRSAEQDLGRASVARNLARVSAESGDEHLLLDRLDEASRGYERALDDLYGAAADRHHLPDAPALLDRTARPRSPELERVDEVVADDLMDAYEASSAFNTSASGLEAFWALRSLSGASAGKKAYVLGTCVAHSTHTPAKTRDIVTSLCDALGVSNARFSGLFLDGLEAVSDAPDASTRLRDADLTLAGLAGVLSDIAEGRFARERNVSYQPRFREHAEPLFDAHRLHARLCEVHAVTAGCDGSSGQEVDVRDAAAAAEALSEAELTWSLLTPSVEDVLDSVGVYVQSPSAAFPELGAHVTAIRHSGFDTFDADVFAAMDARVSMLLTAGAGQNPADDARGGLPTARDVAAMAKGVVEAGDQVWGSMLDLSGTAAGVASSIADEPRLGAWSNVVAFAQLDLAAMTLGEIHAEAKKRRLTTSEQWEETLAWNDIAQAMTGNLKMVTEFAAGHLEKRAEHLFVSTDFGPEIRERAMTMRTESLELARLGRQLEVIGTVFDVITAVGAIAVLADSDKSRDERLDAAIDLANAGLSIGGTVAGGAVATGLNVIGLGMAWLVLLRDELRRIDLVAKQSYSGLATEAFERLHDVMGKAITSSERLVAAQSLLASCPEGASEAQLAARRALAEKLAGSAWIATVRVHSASVSLTREPVRDFTEAFVGWAQDKAHLRNAYLEDLAGADEELLLPGPEGTADAKVAALRRGAPGVFGAATRLAENIRFFHELRVDPE